MVLTLTSIEGFGIIGSDEDGKLVHEWRQGFKRRVTGIDADSDGNIFVASFTEITQFNLDGEVTWRYSHPKFGDLHSLQVLDNGNILVSAASGERALEVNKESGVVWQWWAGEYFKPPNGYIDHVDWRSEIPKPKWSHLNFAWRIGDETLITIWGGDGAELRGSKANATFLRISKDGQVRWGLSAKHRFSGPHYFLPYNDGYLITDTARDRIVEVSKSGQTVRELTEGISRPRGLRILKNGNILVTNKRPLTGSDFDKVPPAVVELSPEGEIVWRLDLPRRIWETHNCAPFASVRLED